MNELERLSPSGQFTSPPEGVSAVGYTAAAPLALEILPAGHEPGVYDVAFSVYVRTASGAGNLTASALSWDQPGKGLVSVAVSPAAPTATGLRLTVYRTIPSTGERAITYTLTPASMGGAVPAIDVDLGASRVADYVE